MARRRFTFTPYVPPQPPSGSYDPALDAQLNAAQRGLSDLQRDVETQGTRAASDYGLALDQSNRQYGWQTGDVATGQQRSLSDLQRDLGRRTTDLGTSRARGEEDFQRNISMLTRRYQQLGDRQQETANQAGVIDGGAILQAAAKRAENQAIDRQPMDTAHSRFLDDNTLAGQRLGEDYQSAVGRLGEDTARSSERLAQMHGWDAGKLGLAFQRDTTDRTTQLTRAQREAQAFGLDVGAQRAYQAAGSGWAPPGRGEPGGMPKNEYVASTGQHYRVVNGWRYDQQGRRIGRATGRAF